MSDDGLGASPSNNQNKKRRISDSDSQELPQIKRYSYHAVSVKCLVPHQIAGKLLGKGGEKMRKMKEVAPKLFMSKNDEYFPSTDERVLFVGGSLDQVLSVLGEVQAKIVGASQDVNTHQMPPKWRLNQMKIVVANSTCSKIIGNKGEVIKRVRESTDTKITTTPLKQIVGNERVITVSGGDGDVIEALRQILVLVEEDKDARLQNDVSYKKYASAVHPYLANASAGTFASAAAAAAVNPYLGLGTTSPAAAAAAASQLASWPRPGWECLQGVLTTGLPTVVSTAGSSYSSLAGLIQTSPDKGKALVTGSAGMGGAGMGGLGGAGLGAAGLGGAGMGGTAVSGSQAAAAAAAAAASAALTGGQVPQFSSAPSLSPTSLTQAGVNPLELLGAAAASLGAAAATGNSNVVANNASMIECLGGLIAQIARQQRLNGGSGAPGAGGMNGN